MLAPEIVVRAGGSFPWFTGIRAIVSRRYAFVIGNTPLPEFGITRMARAVGAHSFGV